MQLVPSTGAAVGAGEAVFTGVGVGFGAALGDALGLGETVGDALGLGETVGDPLGEGLGAVVEPVPTRSNNVTRLIVKYIVAVEPMPGL